MSGYLAEQYKAVENLKTVLDLVAVIPGDSFKVAIPYIKAVSKFVDVLSAPLKKKKDGAAGAAAKTGNIRVIQSEMTFSGNLTQINSRGDFSFLLPGNKNNSCEDEEYPLYNEVLGRFALLETPKVEVGTSINVENPPLESTVIQRFSFDRSSFKYLFNPAAKINSEHTKMYAAIVVKKKPFVIPPSSGPSYSAFTNIDTVSSLSQGDTTVYITQFVPIECLEQMGAELYFRGGVSASEYTGIYDIQLKLLIIYSFNQIGSNGSPYQAFELITYPVKQVDKLYSDVNPPVRNSNGITISTTNYISNETIFAWDTIFINGDLTTNAGVEIEISAPVIIMNSGSLGQGITLLEKEAPFASCSPIEPFNYENLTTYCTRDNPVYQANQPNEKSASITENVVADKPTSSIPFRSTPNPFTNTFNIEFELESESTTSLMIFDALGRMVKMVIASDNLATGQHQYQIDGSKLQSGVYYVKLQTDNGTQTIKIIKQ